MHSAKPGSSGPVAIPGWSLDGSIIDRFEAVAAACPDALAAADSERRFSYREFAEAAQSLAGSIASAAGDRDGPVAILLRHDARYPLAFMATLAAGRAYVALDPAHPPDRNQRIVNHCGAVAMIASADTAKTAASEVAPGLPLLDVDAPPRTAARDLRKPAPEDVAWITYTSGSTGEPKGVFQDHRGILDDIFRSTRILNITAADRRGSFNPPSVMHGTRIALGALLNGASVHCLAPAALGPARLLAEIRAQGVTMFSSVPSIFSSVAEALAPGEKLDSIRLVYLGGDRVGWNDFDTFRRVCRPDAQFGTHLSSTECSTYLHWIVDEAHRENGAVLPSGRPLDAPAVSLLDEDGAPVPDGEAGEFVISGRHLALGYWNDPDLTARAFSRDPDDPSVRVFRTGDLGRRRADGLIEFAGRKDHQVKVAGYRIEIGEVEAALCTCDGVRDAAVVWRRVEGSPRGTLVAYVEPRRDARGLKPRHVKAMVSRFLTRPMVPALVFVEPALPRLANSKIDRTALFRLDAERAEAARAAPADETLASLIALFEAALGVRGASGDDNLMSLGGDSLQAVEVIETLEKRFGLAIPEDVFNGIPSIAALAGWIDRSRRKAAPSAP